MKTLVVGASGATGKLLVAHLLQAGQEVKVIVRPAGNIPTAWSNNDNITIIQSNISKMGVDEMSKHLADCQAVASCLGHNLTWKGIYGKPRKLVAGAVQLLCDAIAKNAPEKPVRFVLMNTAGNSNRDIAEPISVGEKMVIGLLRWCLPPHPDNEQAADYLRVNVGQKNPHIEWAIVRPDTLIQDDKVTEYSLHVSPTRSALFNPGKTSRINVGHFMARLITDDEIWSKWKGQMPVMYNVAG
ncbi:MAG: SDR family oxidoreductase [Saprospiraceae bacterium]|nr:SDR family oxidoreductase [Saprospiraceae bacterium]